MKAKKLNQLQGAIKALCVQNNPHGQTEIERGIYPMLLGERACYNKERDAMTYTGKEDDAIIAHPPCRYFSSLQFFARRGNEWSIENEAREMLLAVHCVKMVQKYGGVLEHPASSRLWDDETLFFNTVRYDVQKYNLFQKQFSEFSGGIMIDVNQLHFGHKANKPTTLYIVGLKDIKVLEYDIDSSIKATHRVGNFKHNNQNLERLKRLEASATPRPFAEYLIRICKQIIKDRWICTKSK